MIEIPTSFAFLGNRDYINGPTILCGIIRAVEHRVTGPMRMRRVKFQRQSTSNGRLIFTAGEALPEALASANCVFDIAAGGERWRGAFVESGAAPARVPGIEYCVSDVAAADFSGACTIQPRDRDSLIFGLVEANKRVHLQSLAPDVRAKAEVRFGYLENWDVPPAGVAFSGRLAVQNLITQRAESVIRTINRLSYGDGAQLLLCFDVDLKTRHEGQPC